jgi:hypothetical protein
MVIVMPVGGSQNAIICTGAFTTCAALLEATAARKRPFQSNDTSESWK